jgi:hypothetical protein
MMVDIDAWIVPIGISGMPCFDIPKIGEKHLPIDLEKFLEQVQWIWVIANFPKEFLKWLKAGSQSRSYSDWWFHTSPNYARHWGSSCPMVVETCFHKKKKIIKPSIRLLAINQP